MKICCLKLAETVQLQHTVHHIGRKSDS